MYLKRLTMKGFKSFPDRTTLEFGPGTSVIVGPNGSGKSNVTDAVLWALGEQSPAAIRGESMQDVIFGGGPGRQAAHSVMVEVVLDDREGSLGIGPEVSIVRKLDRSGDGEYRLGGARCRLIDVLELLSDTGVGKEMHSVVSQGRVEAVVTSKPRDRRLLIEEAAGLGKHRKRRQRAAQKLERTRENLDRALDVEHEARLRLRPLKRQAEAAELHARLRRQEREARWELARDDLRERRQQLTEATAVVEAARKAVADLEREIATAAASRQQIEAALAQRSSQREELSRRVFAAQSAADRVGFRAESIRGALQTVASRLASSRERLQSLKARAAADQPDPGAAERIAKLGAELEALERDRVAELERQLAELERQRTEAATLQQQRERELEAATVAREQAEAVREAGRERLHEAERELERARRESARVGGELAAVNQFLRSHQSAPHGARSLADSLSVASGHELAVAAALDGRLGAALAADRTEAAKLLDRSGSDGGRALIAPGTGTGATSGEVEQARSAPAPMPGATCLAGCVRGDDDAATLARELLADAWLVDDLEQVPVGFPGVAVTDDGRAYAPARHELRQMPSVGEERVLAQRNRREELVAESEQAVRQELAARHAVEVAVTSLAVLETERDSAAGARRAAVNARDEAAEAQQRLAATIKRRRSAPDEGAGAGRRAQLQAELRAERAAVERSDQDRAQRQAQLEQLAAQIERDEALPPAINGILAELTELAVALGERRAQFEQELTADREAGEHVAEQLRRCAQAEAELQTRRKVAAEALTAAEVRVHRARELQAEVEAQLQQLAAELELETGAASEPLPAERRQELAIQLGRIERRREQLGPVNPLAEKEYEDALAHVDELERERVDTETAIRELEGLIRDTDKQIRESFEQTFNAAAEHFQDLAARVFPGGHGRLRLLDEPDPLKAGAAAADGEAGDEPGPDEPEGDAQRAAGSLDRQGVEIEVTPAGMTMKRLSLLSGGEKSMAALAFLFAVFLARPCPFYIMDEVEAALDDLNLTRFIDLLETYRNRAQFIVVTHQKRTMEAAEALYGISMGADGTSKVISRKLPENAGKDTNDKDSAAAGD
jgi:chromosome segregation protein